MVLTAPRQPLALRVLEVPEPGPGQVLVRVSACGICRTDLHIIDGELDRPALPLVLGHQIVGRVERVGAAAGSGLLPGRASVCRGWAGPAGIAASARADARTCAVRRASPATTWAAAMPSTRWQTLASASRFPRASTMCKPRRCSARPDRLSRAPAVRRCPARRPVRLRSRGAHRGPGAAPSRARGVRVYPRR